MYYKFTFYVETAIKDVDEALEIDCMIIKYLKSKGYEVGFSYGEPLDDDMEECGEA